MKISQMRSKITKNTKRKKEIIEVFRKEGKDEERNTDVRRMKEAGDEVIEK